MYKRAKKKINFRADKLSYQSPPLTGLTVRIR